MLYLVAKNEKVSEVGRLMFFVGLLWAVHDIGSKVVHW